MGYHLKPIELVRTFDDFQHTVAGRFHPINQFARIPTISPNTGQAREAPRDFSQHALCTIAILDGSGMHDHDEQ
jgi:hypothetical protein